MSVTMRTYKQCIHLEGKSINEVFALPCIVSIAKCKVSRRKKSIRYCLSNGYVAYVGDWLCEDENGNWYVLSDYEYNEINKEYGYCQVNNEAGHA